jgi:hypothetical protein
LPSLVKAGSRSVAQKLPAIAAPSHVAVCPSGSGLNISPVITHRFPFTEFKEAIELIKSGNWGKIVLDWSNL